MLKKLLFGASGLIFISLAAFYFYAQNSIRSFPAQLKAVVARSGSQLEYQNYERDSDGLGFKLKQVRFTNPKSKTVLNVQSIVAAIGLYPAWPPARVNISMLRPELVENNERSPASISETTSGVTDLAFALGNGLLAWLGVDISITDGKIAPYGINGITATIRIKNITIDSRGFKSALVAHEILVQEISNLPSLTQTHWVGYSRINDNQLTAYDHSLGIGPFVVAVNGHWDLKNFDWKANFKIPQTSLSPASNAVNAQALSWLRAISGNLRLDFNLEGHGLALDRSKIEGSLSAKEVRMTVAGRNFLGPLVTNSEVNWKKGESKAVFNVNLSETEIKTGGEFVKPKGVPFLIDLSADQDKTHIRISHANILLSNFKFLVSGDLALTDGANSRIALELPNTSLVGWEVFFPRLSKMPARGTLQMQASFEGAPSEWQSGKYSLSLKADHAHFPIYASGFPFAGSQINGWVELNATAHIIRDQGIYRQVAAQSWLDLTQAELRYKDVFNKTVGEAMTADISLEGAGKKIELKKMDLRMGPLLAQAKATIENSTEPKFHFHFISQPTDFSKMAAMINFRSKTLGNISRFEETKGIVALAADYSSANTLSKNDAVTLTLDKVSTIFNDGQQRYPFHNISGSVILGEGTVELRQLAFSAPSTDARIQYKQDQKNGLREFSLEATQFNLTDFWDQRSPASNQPRLLSPTGEWIKSQTWKGKIALQKAEVADFHFEAVNANLYYDKKVLEIPNANLRIFNGTLTGNADLDFNPPEEFPKVSMAIRATGIDSSQLCSRFFSSPSAQNVITGKLSGEATLNFSGYHPESVLKTISGVGRVAMVDAQIKTIAFAQKTSDAFSKATDTSRIISHAPDEERLTQFNTSFSIKNRVVSLSELSMVNPSFEISGNESTVDFDEKIDAKFNWTPRAGLVSPELLTAVADGKDKIILPLNISGTLHDPKFDLDVSSIENRAKDYAANKMKDQLSKKIGGGLGHVLK